MNDEPTLRDIRDVIDGLAAITNSNIDRLEAKVNAGFAELKGEVRDMKGEMRDMKVEMRDMKVEMRTGFDRVAWLEGRIEALESK